MGAFSRRLHTLQTRASGDRLTPRKWLYVPYDQLDPALPAGGGSPAHELGLVMLESPSKAARRPYHKQKLAMVLANGRQFALEQAARGVAVRHGVVGDEGYVGALRALASELGPLTMMEAAERELRHELEPLVSSGALHVVPHTGWLSTRDDFVTACSAPPYRMDAFYRHMRKRTGALMAGKKPLGGKWSHDGDNRKAWRGEPPAPTPPTFLPDVITREVLTLIAGRFAHHPGELDASALPATAADGERLWSWAKQNCLKAFGPFEDAMSVRSTGLFHTRISPLLNLQRLSARDVLADVLELELPLSSQEGFVRQLIGWREFMRHVHRETDGFRQLPGGAAPALSGPGDGGYARWAGAPWPVADGGDGGANPSHLGAANGLPPAYWGAASGFRCLDEVVANVWREGWSHHITRLMVLSNLAMLLDVSPRELTDWFWVAYVDAYDWVVEPNVLAMGSFGVGDLMTTKPYIAGAGYIDRMSDFCKNCAFDPKTSCPFTPLYWAFLARHRETLTGNPRMDMPLRSVGKRSLLLQQRDARVHDEVRDALQAGELLTPELLARRLDEP